MPIAPPEAGRRVAMPLAGEGNEPLVLAVALLALLVARLVALAFNGTDLFFDEAQYWSWSEEPAFGYYSKPPLIAWIIGAATAVCGDGEFCVRLPSPILHTATAGVVYLLGTRLYDRRVGLWAALGYATLPGVSLSAGIISTDVPLLLCWAVALLGFWSLRETRAWWPVLLLGLGLGFGLNAKYAMAYFVLSAALYIAATPGRRALARDPRLWAALALGLAVIAPNILWNLNNGFATLAHTADNANWGGPLFRPNKALEFFGAQFGVFGPILFASLLVITVRAARSGVSDPDRMLLFFALPVIAIVTVQAFISRAHANWAAVAYVSAVVLVAAVLVREASWRWLKGSLGLHVALMLILSIATAAAGRFALPGGTDPFARTLGWRALADETRNVLERARREGRPFATVLTDDRALTAELLYYMRAEPTPVLAWPSRGRPKDHYELSRPFTSGTPEPVLLVSLGREPVEIARAFARVDKVAEVDVPAGAGPARRVVFFRLTAFKGR